MSTVKLPASKSISNRLLILRALSKGLIRIENLSEAEDTSVLASLLRDDPESMDVGHAGTAMRFLTAYLAFRPEDKVLTGSARMCERPIGPLVEALREMGADIQYMDKEGYPPLMIFGRNARFGSSSVSIPGNVSSQFISALLMIAPTMPDGLEIRITGGTASRPYLEMTLGLMARAGIEYAWEGDVIRIGRQAFSPAIIVAEPDWSAASYWCCMALLAQSADLRMPGLARPCLQGDSVVLELLDELGLVARESEAGLQLRKVGLPTIAGVNWDMRNCPDLAQGLIVMLAALGIPGEFRGLESLRIKETDRIAALQNELRKFGVDLVEEEGTWRLEGEFQPVAAEIETYGDHRMAMAFAPLALVCPEIRIRDPKVVVKSYPGFWDDLQKAGFQVIDDH